MAYELPKAAVQLGNLFRTMAAVSTQTGSSTSKALDWPMPQDCSTAASLAPPHAVSRKAAACSALSEIRCGDPWVTPGVMSGAQFPACASAEQHGEVHHVAPDLALPMSGAQDGLVAVRVREWGVLSASLEAVFLAVTQAAEQQ